MPEMTLEKIERLTRGYAEAAGALRESVAELEAELEALKRAKWRPIKALVAKTADAKASLQSAIEGAPELFERPKTQTFCGVKVGYRKGTGGLEWEDDEALVAKIEKYFGEQAEDYLIVRRKPSAEALEGLEAAELKKLGVAIIDAGEAVVIKHVDGAVEQAIKALLKEKVEEALNDER